MMFRQPAGLGTHRSLCVVLAMLASLSACDAGSSIRGSGSSLLNPLFNRWMFDYLNESVKNTQIQYEPSGSGSGLADIQQQQTSFAGSEALLSDAAYAENPGLLMIPVVSAPIAIVYNLPNIVGLKLTRDVLAKVYSLDISHWDDREIQIANPSLALPHERIEVVVRNDSSGTSFVMTSSLSSFGWEKQTGCLAAGRTCGVTKTMTNAGFGAEYTGVKGSTKLAQYVRGTPFSIGYVGVATAIKYDVPFAILQNKVLEMTVANRRYTEFAVASSTFDPVRMTASIHDKVGYPIVGNAYLVYWNTFTTSDPAECETYFDTVDFLHWVVTASSAEAAIQSSHLVANTPEVTNRILAKLVTSTCNGMVWHSDRGGEIYVSVEDEDEANILHLLGYTHHKYTENVIVPEMGKERTNTFVRLHVMESNYTKSKLALHETMDGATKWTWIPFYERRLILVYSFNMQGLKVGLPLPMTVIRQILTGHITSWQDKQITDTSSYLPFPDTAIELVGDESLYASILDEFDMRYRWGDISTAKRVQTDLVNPHAAAEHTAQFGGITVVPEDVAKRWGLGMLEPVVLGIAQRPEDNSYPFVSHISVGIPNSFVTQEFVHLYPDAKLVHNVSDVYRAMDFVRWITSAQPYGDNLHEGRDSTARILVDAGVKEDVHSFSGLSSILFRGIMLNGVGVYKAPILAAPSSASFPGWAIALVVVVLSIIAFAVTLRYIINSRRIAAATKFAPKCSDREISIVFTDILSSSNLWSSCPEAMGTALAIHNELIRNLIDEYEGYEVKTIGDSFMVAFESPHKTVGFLLTMQRKLLRANWPTELLQHEAAAEDGAVWRGLRVRAGMHTGHVTVVRTSSGGYDYVGNAVNLCARLSDSGSGGQVLLSEYAYRGIEESLDDSADVKYLGCYAFRGIAAPVNCLQTLPSELAAGRLFGPLRNATPQDEDAEQNGLERHQSTPSMISDHCDLRDVTNATQILRKWAGRNGLPLDLFTETLSSAAAENIIPPELTYKALTLVVLNGKGRADGGQIGKDKTEDTIYLTQGSAASRGGGSSPHGGAKVVPHDAESRASSIKFTFDPENTMVRWSFLFEMIKWLPRRCVVALAAHVREREKDFTLQGMISE
eukprot:Rhum_TRINITY_DN20980_c0_g1::Rhum_TRINITY_DN20980_c0_g1_i1::g.172662::m.172662